ncbi:sulfate transporter CysZ [Aliikangiella marina]|uniref:Sulfate transporter CysZ n=1 Tax=Aliikangiella marina TaxID=1712262 RepID=A0A545TIA9_9GAMM|nr:sulfate transporter CysZ [Aliikangiella marina]TQV76911.1 sulfate transporter CysZ [Aliikangiella marina]
MQTSSFSGAQYLSRGFSLIWQKGIRRFVFIPLIINLILLSVATFFAMDYLASWYDSLQQSEYAVVQWFVENLGWLFWPLIVIGVFVMVFFLFAFLANWIAAPFNGLLSEAVERHLSGETYREEAFSWGGFFKDIPRLMGREWKKLAYYLPRAIGCLLLFFIIGPIAPIIWFIFNAWMTAIQYIDYPLDNHRIPFARALDIVRCKKAGSFGFGAIIMFITMIPVVNILIMPVAVAGATAMWFEQYRD